jgi:hypothetical protein
MQRINDRSVAFVLLAAILVAGAYLRLEGIGDRLLFGDEHHSLFTKDLSYSEILATYDDRGSHMALPLLQHLSQELFGPGVASHRLPAVVPGIVTLILCWILGRRLVGETPALLATLALSLSPMHIFYSRFGRPYALTVALGLIWVLLLLRLESATIKRGLLCAVALCAALLVYVHLSSLGFLLATALVAGLHIRSDRNQVSGFAMALLASAVFTLLLYFPVWSSTYEFLTRITAQQDPREMGLWDVPTLLAGGRYVAMATTFMLPFALWTLFRERPASARWILASIAGPLVFLWTTNPRGMGFAYSRYLLLALPFLWMSIAWLWTECWRRSLGEAFARQGALISGVLLLVVFYFMGPLAGKRFDDGPFAGSYLFMHELPAFDQPFPDASPFYDRLSQDNEVKRIIEIPELRGRHIYLYRNHFLKHRKQTLIGWTYDFSPTTATYPYVDLGNDGLGAISDVDYLILHRDPEAEIMRYWSFVYGKAWPDNFIPGDRGFMERNEVNQLNLPVHKFENYLYDRYGPPDYTDRDIHAWRLIPKQNP